MTDTTRGGIPGLTRFDHVGVTVPNLEEATRFLVDIVGFEYLYSLGPMGDAEGDWMTQHLNVHPRAACQELRFFRCGPSPVLEVFEFTAPEQRTDPPRNSDVGGHHIAVYVEDIDRAVAYLRTHGVTVLGEPTVSSGPHLGQRWVYFLAPWGLQFELVSYPNGRAFYLAEDREQRPAASGSAGAP